MVKELIIGSKAPAFSLLTDSGEKIALKDLKGHSVILYFYPKDLTPGCTSEALQFRDNFNKFNKLGSIIIGVSKDSVARHQKFKEKYDLPFTLASDENTQICEKYGVWAEKNLYGRKFMGIVRSTFLIDADGVIQGIWRKVKVAGHVEEIFSAAKGLQHPLRANAPRR